MRAWTAIQNNLNEAFEKGTLYDYSRMAPMVDREIRNAGVPDREVMRLKAMARDLRRKLKIQLAYLRRRRG